jgi:hypothetical protein
MKTAIAQREQTGDPLAYFLAGHPAPSGIYREIQTGREIQMEEAGILPASCDGHVAVYIRRPLTWAEIMQNQVNAENRVNAETMEGTTR